MQRQHVFVGEMGNLLRVPVAVPLGHRLLDDLIDLVAQQQPSPRLARRIVFL